MATQFLLLGFILGLSSAIYHSLNSRKKHKLAKIKYENTRPENNFPSFPRVPSPRIEQHRLYPRREIYQKQPSTRAKLLGGNLGRKGKVLVDNWKRSIIGLVELSKRNLESASVQFKAENYFGTVRLASASVENISRALIHCFGGKPEVCSGQSEALKLLALRFSDEKKRKFEGSIDDVIQVFQYKEALERVVKKDFSSSINKEEVRQFLKLSSSTVEYFQRLLIEKFGEEIPPLTKPN